MSGCVSILEVNVLFKDNFISINNQYRHYIFRIIMRTQQDFVMLTYWCCLGLVPRDTKIFITRESNDMKALSPELFRYPSFVQVEHKIEIGSENLLADLEEEGYVLRKFKPSCTVFILESILCSIFKTKYELERTLGTDGITYYRADVKPINRIFLNNIIEVGGVRYRAKVNKEEVRFKVV